MTSTLSPMSPSGGGGRKGSGESEENQQQANPSGHPSASSTAAAARKLHTHAGVAALLNARPGKMSLTEMHKAVAAQQQRAKVQERKVQTMAQRNQDEADGDAEADQGAGQDSLKKHTPPESHPLDYSTHPDVDASFSGETLQMRELVFARSLSLYEQHERSLLINPTKHRIGHAVMTEQQRDELERQREHAKAVAKAAQRAAERAQSSTVCSSARVVSLVGETTRARPTFDVDAAAPWPARGRLLARWLASVDKFVVRRRVDARLAAMAAHAADRARRKDALAHQRDQGQGAEGGVLAPRQHPLVPSSLENDEEFVCRDFQLCTNNVQSVGHIRGHDSVLRSAVALDAIHPPASLVTFDEVVAFDFATGAAPYPSVCPATCPAFVRDDWIELQRTGAWEESVLRAPRGELEPSSAVTAAEEKKSASAPSAPASSASGPLVIHATMPAAPHAAAAQLTSPARTSVSLVDVEVQNSRPLPSKHAAVAAAAAAGASSGPSSSPSAAAASRSHSSASNLRMPDQLLQYNPVAHQHSVAPHPPLSVVSEAAEMCTETSAHSAFRAATMADPQANHGYYYTQEFAGSSSLRTLSSMPSLHDLWRPQREPVADVAQMLAAFSLPARMARPLRRPGRQAASAAAGEEAAEDDDEQSANLLFRPPRPTPAAAAALFAPVPAAVPAAQATQSGGLASPTSASAAAAAASSAQSSTAPSLPLDLGLGVPLISTAVQFPPALAEAAARALAAQQAAQQAAAARAASSSDAAASGAAAGGSSTSRSGRAESDGGASARREKAGSPGPDVGGKRRKGAKEAPPPAPLQPAPRARARAMQLAPGVPAAQCGVDLLLPPGSVAAATLAAASSGAPLLPAPQPSHQARTVEAFRAAAAAASSADIARSGHPSSVAWGPGGQAAAEALQHLLTWQQVQATNVLPLATQSLRSLTQHPQHHLTLLTHK